MPHTHLSSSSLPVSSAQEPFAKPSGRSEKVPSKKIIRDLGLKVTTQRVLILEVVRKGPSHFTAQDIFERVAEKNPAVGFATVYRFLRTLSEHLFVTEVRMGGMPARYEWAAKRHHDHLTCNACGKIVEFENPEIERLQEKVAREFGFMLVDHLLELYGVCADCKRKDTPALTRPNHS
jgi:Fur family ferric uptake transcriptional regulator